MSTSPWLQDDCPAEVSALLRANLRSPASRYGVKQGALSLFDMLCRALIAYVNILADVLSSVAGTIVPPGAEPSRNVMMAGITFMGAL